MELHLVYCLLGVLCTLPGVYTYNAYCDADIQNYYTSLISLETWAVQMYDAHGKTEPGQTLGNTIFEGRKKICMKVKSAEAGSSGNVIQAKYCWATWKFYDASSQSEVTSAISVCLPDTCSDSDVRQYVDSLPDEDVPPGRAMAYERYESCNEGAGIDIKEDGAAIAAIVILIIFGLLGIMGTLYDCITYKRRHPGACNNSCSGSKKRTNNIENHDNGATQSNQKYSNRVYEGERTEKESVDGQMQNGEPERSSESTNDGQVAASEGQVVVEEGNMDESSPKTYQPNVCEKLMLCFSFYTNAGKITNFKHMPGSFQSLNALRFLAMAWIVLGHTWVLGVTLTESVAFQNMVDYHTYFNARQSQQTILQMDLAVETFFVLSAMLTTISLLKQLNKFHGKPPCSLFGMYYFHRYWRLTPVYMLIVMFYAVIYPHMGYGQLWPAVQSGPTSCRPAWWPNLFYINNMIGLDCLGWSWYLANDFQFYVAAPLFIYLLYRKPIAGIIVTSLGIVGCIVALGYLNYNWLIVYAANFGYFYSNIYIKPWCRISSYLIGVLLGYILHRKNYTVKMNRIGVGIAWVLCFVVIHLVIFGSSYGNSSAGAVAYQTFRRPVFAASVSWVIFACITGYGGIFNTIFSWPGWLPLARLSYTGYLIHPIVIYYIYYNSPVQIFMDDTIMIYYFLGHLMLTLGISFIVSLFLELPFLALEKVMFEKVKIK